MAPRASALDGEADLGVPWPRVRSQRSDPADGHLQLGRADRHRGRSTTTVGSGLAVTHRPGAGASARRSPSPQAGRDVASRLGGLGRARSWTRRCAMPWPAGIARLAHIVLGASTSLLCWTRDDGLTVAAKLVVHDDDFEAAEHMSPRSSIAAGWRPRGSAVLDGVAAADAPDRPGAVCWSSSRRRCRRPRDRAQVTSTTLTGRCDTGRCTCSVRTRSAKVQQAAGCQRTDADGRTTGRPGLDTRLFAFDAPGVRRRSDRAGAAERTCVAMLHASGAVRQGSGARLSSFVRRRCRGAVRDLATVATAELPDPAAAGLAYGQAEEPRNARRAVA